MGSSESSPSPPPPAQSANGGPGGHWPWRTVTWSEKEQILPFLEAFKASTGVLRILLYGPTGAGKSCFINSIQKFLLGRNVISAQEQTTRSGTSFTVMIKTHKMKKCGGGRFPFVFQDIMGLEPEDLGGIQTDDVINILEGHILNGYDFNPLSSIKKDNPKYNPNPKPGDKVHCLVCMLPADSVSRIDDKVFEKMSIIRKRAADLDIPQVIVLTKVDQACEVVNKDLKKFYWSKKIKDKMQICSNRVGISMNNIYPVQNYYAEITPDEATDVLLSMALRDIVNFANDYVEESDEEFEDRRIQPN